VNRDRTLNSYDAAGNSTEEVDLYWIDGAWRNHERHVHVYDEFGREVEWEEYSFYGQSTDWEPQWRDIYRYDDQGRHVGRVGYRWKESVWSKVLRTTTSRNDSGQEVETLNEDWTGTEWVFSSRFRITCDDAGNPLESLWQNWSGREFVNTYRRLKKYDTGISSAIRELVPYADHSGDKDGVVLHPNYPNPFATSTTISFELSNPAEVTVAILDLLGRVIQVVVDADLVAGTHRIDWRPTDLGSGVYMVRVAANGVVATRSMLLVE
jgi:hypothetical protein